MAGNSSWKSGIRPGARSPIDVPALLTQLTGTPSSGEGEDPFGIAVCLTCGQCSAVTILRRHLTEWMRNHAILYCASGAHQRFVSLSVDFYSVATLVDDEDSPYYRDDVDGLDVIIGDLLHVDGQFRIVQALRGGGEPGVRMAFVAGLETATALHKGQKYPIQRHISRRPK